MKKLYVIIFLAVIASGAKQSLAQDIWTQKANFGGFGREGAVGFSIGTKGYIGTGSDSIGYTQDFWEWDQVTNVWTQKATFAGAARANAVGFSIGTKGYIGTGMGVSNNLKITVTRPCVRLSQASKKLFHRDYRQDQ
jgi:N-acetylneuraminic acid mutarotase